MSSSDGDDAGIGPQLPPSLSGPQRPSPAQPVGPQLPHSASVGPQRPPTASVVPQMPSKGNIGPQMPAELVARLRASAESQHDDADSSEDDCVGPRLPSSGDAGEMSVAEKMAAIERRAEKMRRRLNGEDMDTAPVRETWMLELPPEKNISGLVARTFSTRDNSRGDASAWTDTPADKEKKRKEREERAITGAPPPKVNDAKKRKIELEDAVAASRDQQLRQQLDEYNKDRRGVSLMDMHRKDKAAGAPRTDPGVTPYRPFNRDTEMEGRGVDAKKRRDMIERAKDFGTKFAPGRSSFL